MFERSFLKNIFQFSWSIGDKIDLSYLHKVREFLSSIQLSVFVVETIQISKFRGTIEPRELIFLVGLQDEKQKLQFMDLPNASDDLFKQEISRQGHLA